jgi:hypothetical protein
MDNVASYTYKAGNHVIKITEDVNHNVLVTVDGKECFSDGTPPPAVNSAPPSVEINPAQPHEQTT